MIAMKLSEIDCLGNEDVEIPAGEVSVLLGSMSLYTDQRRDPEPFDAELVVAGR